MLWLSGALALAGAAPVPVSAGGRPADWGKRIYERGILPDGSPLVGIEAQGTVMRGSQAACTTCHRRSGYGSMEGNLVVPPIAGAVLFAPGTFGSGIRPSHKGQRSQPTAVERFRARSAYDEGKLARALKDGIDPDGTPLQQPMPHYRLDARAVSALAAYLRQLSAGASPGIEEGTIHLGTVFTPDVPPEQREALLEVVRAFAATRGKWGMPWQLHVWPLTGPPQAWGAQLEENYRQQPVFALLSGAGTSNWLPVHDFCEQKALACVLPSVELAPEQDDDHYSFYFSPGLALEAQFLVHHLGSEPRAPRRLIQVVADDSGRRAAAAVRRGLAQAGSPVAAQEATVQEFQKMAPPSAGEAVVLWLRPRQLVEAAAVPPRQPPQGELFLSALLAPPEEVALPTAWKARAFYLSAFDPLATRRAQVTLLPWLDRQHIPDTNLRLRGDAYAACNFFNNALTALQDQNARGIRGPLTRERLLETLETVMTVFRDDAAPYYWQLSLGPGQRVPVTAGTLLRYVSPDSNELVAVEGRVVP
jgi:hypothetical protein